jgi:hypothetical protein
MRCGSRKNGKNKPKNAIFRLASIANSAFMSAHKPHDRHHSMKTHTNTAIPATENESWGFWGTMRGHASVAWPLAMTAIAEATGESLDAVRAFLDSKAGRHFADEVCGHQSHGQALPDAIANTVAAWMRMTIKRRTAIDYGIPHGVPYLTGFVMHAAIHDETAED